MWFVNAAINTANKIDEITGRKASKFLKKNAGKLIGSAVKKGTDLIGKPEWGEKVANVVDKGAEAATAALGKDNIITKNVSNAASEMKGISTPWTPVENIPTNVPGNQLVYYQPPQGYYNRNIGGTNFLRYRPSRRNTGKRIKVSKFAKKKKQKKLF